MTVGPDSLPKAPHTNGKRARRILILSYAYPPSVGGIERVSELLADGLRERGWDVRVATWTPGDQGKAHVIRQPSMRTLVRGVRWADAVIESNPSLRLSWPLAFHLVRTPRVTVIHTSLRHPGSPRRRLRDQAKVWLLPSSDTYTVSEWLARSDGLSSATTMINPYDDTKFFSTSTSRDGEVLFVGRLVMAKGVDLLLEALHRLSPTPTLTVIGDGPERARLETEAGKLGLEADFLGSLASQGIAEQMRRHKVLAIPSRLDPPEAFGIVVIEGIASGCRIVATQSGGLPEVVSQFGSVVPVGDSRALAISIQHALNEPQDAASDEQARESYLRRFGLSCFLDEYETAIQAAMSRMRNRRRPFAKWSALR